MKTLKDFTQVTEIARSFSYKLNVGNFETRDFFCSQKVQCKIEDAGEVSALLEKLVRSEVIRAVNAYQDSRRKAYEKKIK